MIRRTAILSLAAAVALAAAPALAASPHEGNWEAVVSKVPGSTIEPGFKLVINFKFGDNHLVYHSVNTTRPDKPPRIIAAQTRTRRRLRPDLLRQGRDLLRGHLLDAVDDAAAAAHADVEVHLVADAARARAVAHDDRVRRDRAGQAGVAHGHA